MIGNRYWCTGITLHPCGDQWSATLTFLDDGFCDDESTEGTMRTRYYLPTAYDAVVLLKADAERLGIVWKDPAVYVVGGGEHPDVAYPDGWREMVRDVAERLGWWSPMPMPSRHA